jgi:predicted Zn-dependent protease
MSLEERPVAMSKGWSSRSRLVWAIVGGIAILAVSASLVLYLRSKAKVHLAARLAREAVADHRSAEARKLIDEWAALSPRDGEPDYYRALLDIRTERPAEALDAMRKSIALGYPQEPLMILRAVLMSQAGIFDEAEPVLTRAFEHSADPKAEVAEGLSRIYLKTFRLAEANHVLDSWKKAAPEDPRPYLRRNEMDERIGSEPPILIRNYREALRRDPSLISARLGLAEKLREASLVDEAEAEYAMLLERDPKNIQGLVGAGRIALLKGDLQAATLRFEDALKLSPKDKVALRELGQIDLNSGRITQACARLKTAVEVDPYDPEVRFSYARALKIAGDEPRAAEEAAATDRLKKEQQYLIDLRQKLMQRPDDADLRCETAKWLIEHGHEKEGLEWTGLILRQRPGHPPTCRLLAEYHASRGNFGLANYYRVTEASTTSEK